jgi:hypothetical protein
MKVRWPLIDCDAAPIWKILKFRAEVRAVRPCPTFQKHSTSLCGIIAPVGSKRLGTFISKSWLQSLATSR